MSRSATSDSMTRRQVIDLINEALSRDYHSFVGHALGSNPYVTRECESDLATLESIRDEENASVRSLLVQLGRYRAGPTLRAFHLWKEDLNFLSLEWLVIRAAEEAAKTVARIEALVQRLPTDDPELTATFDSLLRTKREHLKRLAPLAEKRRNARAVRRATHHAATMVQVKGIGGAAPAKAAPAAAPPRPSGGPPAPQLPGGFKLPPGAPKPPGAPRPPTPPLPPGMKLPPGPPKAPSGPPSPPAAPAAPQAPAAPATPAQAGGRWPPLPPGFRLPPKR